MYPEKKGVSRKLARPQQNWGLLTLLTRWASTWTMPNTASPKSEPPCGRAVYTPVRATILGHPPQKTAPGGKMIRSLAYNLRTRWFYEWKLWHDILFKIHTWNSLTFPWHLPLFRISLTFFKIPWQFSDLEKIFFSLTFPWRVATLSVIMLDNKKSPMATRLPVR